MTQINKWPVLGRALLFCLSCTVTLAITSGLTKSLGEPWSNFASLSSALLITFAFTVLFTRWERTTLKDVGMMPGKQSISHILSGFIIGLIMSCMQPLLLLLFSNHIRLALAPGSTLIPIIASFLLYVLVAAREEMAFRAYPLRTLDKTFGPWVALLIIFIFFSLEHVAGGMNWVQAFTGAGIGSILFGIAALSTKGLAVPVGLHIAWNFGQWALGFKDNTGVWRAIVDKGYETQMETLGLISYLIVMLVGITGFYFYWRKKGISISG